MVAAIKCKLKELQKIFAFVDLSAQQGFWKVWEFLVKLFPVQNKVLNIYLSIVSKSCCIPIVAIK
jgi:hypothetical protein